jgi:hypothetical protein
MIHVPKHHEDIPWALNYSVDDIYKNHGLDDIVTSYPFVKKYSRIFLGLLNQWVNNFYVHGEWNNAVIIMADNKKDIGWFVIKIPKKQDYNISREYANHVAFLDMLYNAYQQNDTEIKKVVIPQINSLSSQDDAIIVMDRLPWKSVKRILLEYFFRPLFDNKKYMDRFELNNVSNDMEIIHVLQNDVQKEIKNGYIDKNSIVIAKHKNKAINDIIDIIGLRWIDNKSHLYTLQDAIWEKRAKEIRDIVSHFISYSQENGCTHNDLNNAGNIYIMGTPSRRQVGIIDFGSAKVLFKS